MTIEFVDPPKKVTFEDSEPSESPFPADENRPLKFPDRFGTRPKPTPPTVPPPPAIPTFSPDDAKNLILILRRAPLQNLDEADIIRESLIRFITHVNAVFAPRAPS